MVLREMFLDQMSSSTKQPLISWPKEDIAMHISKPTEQFMYFIRNSYCVKVCRYILNDII